MINLDPIQFWEPLLKVIRSAEASPDNKKRGTTQYDSVVASKPLARLDTVSIQEAVKLAEDERPGSKYIGAYQFNKDNLIDGDNWVASAGLKPTDLFNKKNQDTIAIWLISSNRRRKGIKWLNGNLITEDFMVELAKEWAGLPVPYDTKRKDVPLKAGQSYWDGVGTNSSNVSISQVVIALESIYLSYTGNYPDYSSPNIKNNNTSNGIPPVAVTTSPIQEEQLQQEIESPFESVSRDDFVNIVSEEQYIRLNIE